MEDKKLSKLREEQAKLDINLSEDSQLQQLLISDFYELELSRRKKIKILYSIIAVLVAALLCLIISITGMVLFWFIEDIAKLGVIFSLLMFAVGGMIMGVIFSDYRRQIKKEVVPAFIENFYPTLHYQPYMHISTDEIPGVRFENQFIEDPLINNGANYLQGKIGKLNIEFCQLSMGTNDKHEFRGLLLKVSALPAYVNPEWLSNQNELKNQLLHMEAFWGNLPYWVSGKTEGIIFLYIPSSKSFLEIWPNEHFLRSGLFTRIKSELEHSLHIVELLDKLIK